MFKTNQLDQVQFETWLPLYYQLLYDDLQENKKLTNVGISLHKQGQVIEHFVRKEAPIQPNPKGNFKTYIQKNLHRHKPEIFLEKHVSPRTQQLLNKKRRLQSILAELKLLAQAKKNLEALQPSLKLQEKILNWAVSCLTSS